MNVVLPPTVTPMNGVKCQSAAAGRAKERTAMIEQTHNRSALITAYANSLRKRFANTDFVGSPSCSWYGATRPSLFASRISVSRLFGTLMMSDEYAFGTYPKCQTMG